MEKFVRRFTVFAAVLVALLSLGLSSASAQDANVRVIVPDRPDGVIVSGCYQAVGRLYGARFEFCLKRRGSYTATTNRVTCDGRLDWNVEGIGVNIKLRRTSCGRGQAWSADTVWCRPNLVAGIIGLIANSKDPFLAALSCTYTPARGSGETPRDFVARRQS